MSLAWSHKSFEKVSSSASGLPKISSTGERKSKFRSWKIFLQCFRSAIFFHSLYMRSLHYAILFFSGVVDIIKDPRHQLIINKAQTPLRPRHSNFCHGDNYLLFFSSLTFFSQILGTTWPPAATRVPSRSKRQNPGKAVGDVIEFSDGLLTATLMVGGRWPRP